MSLSQGAVRCFMALTMLTAPVLSGEVSADHLFARLKRMVGEAEYHGTPPCMGYDGAVECLAENIDWLEHYIDTYGSVVAKQADIWGEARLTKHRFEYERIMFGELNQFKSTINAAISQGDSSFLAQAISLSAAASDLNDFPALPVQAKDAPSAVAINGNDLTVAAPDAAPVSLDARFGLEGATNGIKLEPVTFLDQQSRYLQHLHELRRINEGDDTSDSPGYSLNLVRIPVSILPGKLTRQGFGAEVTITATPVIGDDLMPTTFRNLVINDLVDQLGLPIVRYAEQLALDAAEKGKCASTASTPVSYASIASLASMDMARKAVTAPDASVSSSGRLRRAVHPVPPTQVVDVYGPNLFCKAASFFCPVYRGRHVRWAGSPRCCDKPDDPCCTGRCASEHRINLLDVQKWLGSELSAAYELLSLPKNALLWQRLARPESGLAAAIRGGRFKCEGSDDKVICPAEASELTVPPCEDLFIEEGTAEDIETGYLSPMVSESNLTVEDYRECFFENLRKTDAANCVTPLNNECSPQPGQHVLDELAWAIVVESALLNDRLNNDVRKLARAKGAQELDTNRDYQFFLSDTVATGNPMLEAAHNEFRIANDIFKRYVEVRWPIHVFAIDPREQDQNVADVSLRKRELQFALALGFVTGKVGANSLTQFSREL